MNNVVKTFYVDSFTNLHFRIFTTGYPGYGESILSVIYNGNIPLFSAITDCYRKDTEENCISSLLKKLGITTIDYFIWTHPDDDHSVGIIDLLKTFDPEAKADIFLPQALGTVKMNGEAYSSYKYILQNYNSGKKYHTRPISVDYREGLLCNPLKDVIKFIDRKSGREIHCEFIFLLPHAQLLLRDTGKQTFSMNDLSIFYYIKFNGFTYIFGGDLDKQSLQFLDLNMFQNVAFVKIPHHGSDRVIAFPKGLKANGYQEAMCTCTQFVHGKSNLPIDATLQQYRPFSKRIYKTTDNNAPFGFIDIDFNINNLYTSVTRYGNTQIYYKKRTVHQQNFFA